VLETSTFLHCTKASISKQLAPGHPDTIGKAGPVSIIIGSHLERKDPKARQILDRAAIPMLDRCTGVTVRC
jgi:hypothetical protein